MQMARHFKEEEEEEDWCWKKWKYLQTQLE